MTVTHRVFYQSRACLSLLYEQSRLSLSLSLSLISGRGAGHRPNPFQVAPEASWVSSEGVSWPGVPPGMIMGRTPDAHRLVGAVQCGQMALRISRSPNLIQISVFCVWLILVHWFVLWVHMVAFLSVAELLSSCLLIFSGVDLTAWQLYLYIADLYLYRRDIGGVDTAGPQRW